MHKHVLTATIVTILSYSSTAAPADNELDDNFSHKPTKIELVANAASFLDVPQEVMSLAKYPQLFGLNPYVELPLPRAGDVIGLQLNTVGWFADRLGLKSSPHGSQRRVDDLEVGASNVEDVTFLPVLNADGRVKENGLYKLEVPRPGLFEAGPKKIEHAVGEEPLWRNKGLEAKESVQSLIQDIAQHKPVVDTISEKDKYGNTGEKLKGLSNVVVRGYEGFSRILNSVLETPKNFLQNIGSIVNDKLNNLGAKIIGF